MADQAGLRLIGIGFAALTSMVIFIAAVIVASSEPTRGGGQDSLALSSSGTS